MAGGFDDTRTGGAAARSVRLAGEARAVEDLRDALDELIDAFRTVVRGVPGDAAEQARAARE
ncbi:hypothetical protein K7G98_11160 [Saccharothrix sp. MB29]|nr:hypothetical protein [Saccharothrix sp. MB29]